MSIERIEDLDIGLAYSMYHPWGVDMWAPGNPRFAG